MEADDHSESHYGGFLAKSHGAERLAEMEDSVATLGLRKLNVTSASIGWVLFTFIIIRTAKNGNKNSEVVT